MNRTTLSLTLTLLLSAPAFGQTFDADGRRIDGGLPKAAPDAALYNAQSRSAAVLGGLVDQTLEYQHGHALHVEAVRNREAAARRSAMQAETGTEKTGTESRSISYEDQANIENLNKDLHKRDTTEAERRSTRDELRQVYGRYGQTPIAPEPPPRPKVVQPKMPSNFSIGSQHFSCIGNSCY